MRVVLVYVGIGVAGFNANRPAGDREGSWIGHGVASVGASLRAAGHEVSLIDLRQLSGWPQVREALEANPADVYGLSVSAVDHQAAVLTALLVRDVYPRARILVGGIHPSIFSDLYIETPVDTVVVGEGEVSAVKLLQAMECGREWPAVVLGEKPDLDAIPWAARDLFDYPRELACTFAPDQKTPSVTMLAGRGCAFRCSYCQPAENAVFGHPYRMRSPESVVGELIALKRRYSFRSVTFWDDTFTFRPSWIEAFCYRYEAARIGATIAACSRADIVCANEAMIERLASVGLDWLVIGFESGSQRILDLIRKGTTVKQNLEAARICRKYGIKVFGTFMLGLPTETRAEALATARMIDEIAPEHPSPFYFFPIPGTDLYTECRDRGLLLVDAMGRSIARTGVYARSLSGIDYDYLDALRCGHREEAA